MKKNDHVTLTIEDIGAQGEGIGKLDGFPLFVEGGLPGDVLEVRIVKLLKRYGYGKLARIITPSPKRVQPPCPVFAQCGGCSLQHLDYPAQVAFKEKKVRDCLERIGKIERPVMEPAITMAEPWAYRNKGTYPVGMADSAVLIGFYAKRSHRIVQSAGCLIQPEVFNAIIQRCTRFFEQHRISIYDEVAHQGLIRHVMIRKAHTTGEIMVVLVVNGGNLPQKAAFVTAMQELGVASVLLNINKNKTNVVLGEENIVLWGENKLEDILCGLQFEISPQAFYQVNSIQTEKLYQKVLDYCSLTGSEMVVDLYCGIGTISLLLAQKARFVLGIEYVPQAVMDAKANAQANNIENVDFLAGPAEEILPAYYKETGQKPQVVVLDPPRKGCDKQVLDTIIAMEPEKIVYVSCDPATLARDIYILTQGGYVFQKGVATDMFPMSHHVETVVLLSKLNSSKSIEVEIDLNEMDLTKAESKATYAEIKEYVLENAGFKVSQLYIAQVKRKHGLIERINYNIDENKAKAPQVPPEKEKAIEDALRHFKMIG